MRLPFSEFSYLFTSSSFVLPTSCQFRVCLQHPLVPSLTGCVESQAETIGVRLFFKAVEDVDLLPVSLPSIQDVATEVVISCDAKEAEKPDSVLIQCPISLFMEHNVL